MVASTAPRLSTGLQRLSNTLLLLLSGYHPSFYRRFCLHRKRIQPLIVDTCTEPMLN